MGASKPAGRPASTTFSARTPPVEVPTTITRIALSLIPSVPTSPRAGGSSFATNTVEPSPRNQRIPHGVVIGSGCSSPVVVRPGGAYSHWQALTHDACSRAPLDSEHRARGTTARLTAPAGGSAASARLRD